MKAVEQVVGIVNPLGVHARPAAEFVKLASTFKSEITVVKLGNALPEYVVNGDVYIRRLG